MWPIFHLYEEIILFIVDKEKEINTLAVSRLYEVLLLTVMLIHRSFIQVTTFTVSILESRTVMCANKILS